MHGWIPANLFFSSVEAFLSLAHSSAKGYYATDREGLYYERQNYYANRACAINCHGQLYSLVKLGSCTRAGHTLSAAPGGHTTYLFY